MMAAVRVALLALVAALVGCMEVEQTASAPRQGKYQGKTDTRPWDNEPLALYGGKWSKGDKASWEKQIVERNLRQDETVRIGK